MIKNTIGLTCIVVANLIESLIAGIFIYFSLGFMYISPLDYTTAFICALILFFIWFSFYKITQGKKIWTIIIALMGVINVIAAGIIVFQNTGGWVHMTLSERLFNPFMTIFHVPALLYLLGSCLVFFSKK